MFLIQFMFFALEIIHPIYIIITRKHKDKDDAECLEKYKDK